MRSVSHQTRRRLFRLPFVVAFCCQSAFPQLTLKQAFKEHFLIGAALNRAQFSEEDARGAAIVKAHFNTISPENVLKWESVHPQPGRYDFAAADRYVEFVANQILRTKQGKKSKPN